VQSVARNPGGWKSTLVLSDVDHAALGVAYAVGRPEWLAKIAEAKTLTEIQRLFIEIVDENTAGSKQAGA